MPLDFSDARYLGMRHGSRELGAWHDLATGVPAAFHEVPEAVAVGRSIAHLQGLEDGVVATSTLHLFWDWFGTLSPRKHIVFTDEYLYQVGASGVERAKGRTVPIVRFGHLSPLSLRFLLQNELPSGKQPIVVTDGWCPLCGKAAPLQAYLEILRPYGGWLVVDDTQALGVVKLQDRVSPHGRSGSTIGKSRTEFLAISSLAKGFGVPLAALCGSEQAIAEFRAVSKTRMFASPPNMAAVRAAQHALQITAAKGAILRGQLLRNIQLFKASLAASGVVTGGGMFPVQFLRNHVGKEARPLHAALWRLGIRAVLSEGHGSEPMLCFLLNARMTDEQIKWACRVISLEAQKATSAASKGGNQEIGEIWKLH